MIIINTPHNPTGSILRGSDIEQLRQLVEEFDLLIKPKANQLVFFPSGSEFRHEVKPVISGDRYTLASFYTTDKLVGLHRKIRELL